MGAVGWGWEHLRLRLGEESIEADGVVVGEEDGTAFRVRYVIRCDPRWRTRLVIVDPLDERDSLHLCSDGKGNWSDASGQRYTCLERNADGGLYRYEDESLFRGFTADLPVDADGLVLNYPGIFRRIS